jgi:ATP-binding cassette subfamily F protein 3
MPLASITNLEKTFGKRVIFEHLDFRIDAGERVGLIGANGAGKTTLFKILTGEITPDSGSVSIAKTVKVGHLSQNPTFDMTNTVMDEAELAFAALHALSHQMRELEHAMADHAGDELEKTLEQYQNVQHEFDLAGGYAWQHKLEATLLGVGLERGTWEQPVGTLSGGQRSRVALAKLLISEPDMLLLDEPTNHLDLAAIEWLENYLLAFRGAVLLISHDRYLLDKLATRIVWLTGSLLKSYPGNYSAFTEQRELAELSQQRAYEEQRADIEKQQEYIRRFGAGQRARQAMGRRKRLERLLRSDEVIGAVANQKAIKLSLDTDQRSGDLVLRVQGLTKAFGERRLWDDAGFMVKRGERVGIIGPNGSGKTTLLEVLLGRADADAGTIRWGANLSLGYYDQKLDAFFDDPDSTAFEEVNAAAAEIEGATEKDVRDVLAMMLFRGDDVDKPMGLLSGGERARVRLAQLLLEKPNVFLLDEPTNHLDIASREALEGALKDFPGTILCVSHDRYFLDQVAQRLLVVDPPKILDFEGGYSKWSAKAPAAPVTPPRKSEAPKSAGKAAPAKPTPPPGGGKSTKKDNPYARPFGRLSVGDLERQISQTESALQQARASFANTHTMRDPRKAKQLQNDHDELAAKLEALEAEYFDRNQ